MKLLGGKARYFVIASVAALTAVFSACSGLHDPFRTNSNNDPDQPAAADPASPRSIHMAFGNPSNASPDAANDENFLLIGQGSAVSYNNRRGTANWVSWRTTRTDLGGSLPRPDFRPDPRLPHWYKRVGYYDYSGSGYDRGHLVPSADRFADPAANEETFLMTNIVPQAGDLNRYAWEDLESYVRAQVRRGFDAYQIAGVHGERGMLKGKVVVPASCWKIVVLLPRGRGSESIDARTRTIAVDMPNMNGIGRAGWEKYRTTIRSIEQRTGLDFFADMPRAVQDAFENARETVSP